MISSNVVIMTKDELQVVKDAKFARGVKRGEHEATYPTCHAGKDGECSWWLCPQERDGEPAHTGRICPFYKEPDYY